MAKTETNVSTLKINRGTYAKVQENLSSITENELIITSDKNVPIPTTNDNGKAVVVNASGEYELGNAGTNVVANPTLAGTESALTGLQVGDTKYAVPTPHTINTYTLGALSEADQAKIAEDIANGYPIIVGQVLYTYWGGANEVYFVHFSASPTNNDFSINTITYNKTSHQLRLTTGKQNRPINTEALNYSDISGALLTKLNLGGQDRVFGAMSMYVTTTAPTADNTDGGIRIVKLTSEPATKYNGYLYIITA